MRSHEHSRSASEERSYRLPGDLSFLERVRMGVIARRAEILDTGDFVNADGTRRASVSRGTDGIDVTIERNITKITHIRTKVDLSYNDVSTLPHISADQEMFRVMPDGNEEVLESGHYSASSHSADNTLSLEQVSQAVHMAKQLQSGDPA